MSHQKTIFLALSMLLLLFPNVIHAEDSGTITGVVLDSITKKPLPGIQIRIVHSSGKTCRTITDKEGNFSIGIPLEEYNVEAKGRGYSPAAKRVRVISGEIVRADFELSSSLTFYGEEFVVAAPKPSPKEEVIISKEMIDASQIKDSSVSLFNDLSETLKTMPGVITSGNFSGEMFVRGGTPLETIYVLDQVFIDWPYRWGGMMTMFNTRLIEDVDFYAGGFPAEGGNSLAGVIDVKYKKGDLKKSSGLLEISPTTTELFLNGPIKKEKSSYLFSAKRTYYDFLAKFFTGGKDANVFPYFHDGFFKLYFDLSPAHKLTIFSVYAGEGMDMKIEEDDDPGFSGGRFTYNYQTGILAACYKRILTEKLFIQTTLSDSLDKGEFDLHAPEYIWKEDMKPGNIDLRSDIDWQAAPSHKIRCGTYLSDNKVNFSGSFNYEIIQGTETLIKGTETESYDFKKNARYIGSYVWDRWNLSPRLTADIGLRHESLDLVKDTALTPRLSLKFDISDKTSLKLAYAHNSQFPTNIYLID
ncbi:MAG: TonB-dependent receptor [Candidatus Desantisbacteria bacterium]